MRNQLTLDQINAALERSARLEQLERAHMAAEGRSPVNENPDGCWHCGSMTHHSGDCTDRE